MITDNTRSIALLLRKPFYENYLRHLFKSPCGPIKVSRTDEIGKYLYSRVRYSPLPLPVKRIKQSHVINLVLPDHPTDMSHYHFIYYNEDDMVRINDFIEAIAYLDFRLMVQVGTNEMELDRKKVISLFSERIFGEDKYEMLKKDEYRRRKKMEEWLFQSVQQFGY